MNSYDTDIIQKIGDLFIIVLDDNKQIKKLQQQIDVLCNIIEDHNIALRCNHSDIVGKLSDYGYKEDDN